MENKVDFATTIITEPNTPEEHRDLIRLNSYQISRLVVGINVELDSLTQAEINTMADINQDGFISAFDAYLAYSISEEI